MNFPDIKDLIPQREPFLLVDSLLEWDENKAVGIKKLTGEEDFFKGHFPGNPVMPGVLMQEALFQTAAAFLGLLTQKLNLPNKLGVVTKVDKVKYKKLLRPDDELILKVELIEKLDNAFYFKGHIENEGKKIMSAEFTCAQIS